VLRSGPSPNFDKLALLAAAEPQFVMVRQRRGPDRCHRPDGCVQTTSGRCWATFAFVTSPTACRAALLVVVALVVAGCGSSSTPAVPAGALPPRPAVSAGVLPTKMLVIAEENHTETSALQQMPYLAALADAYGHTTDYQAVAHPSLPNYLALAGGSTFGVTRRQPTVEPPSPATACSTPRSEPGPTPRTPARRPTLRRCPCRAGCSPPAATPSSTTPGPTSQTPKPGPTASASTSLRTTSTGALRTDVDAGSLPGVGKFVPDLCHDAHDCSLGTADDWLRQWMPVLMGGPDYRSGQLALVVTFDEDDNSGPNTVLTTVTRRSSTMSSAPRPSPTTP